jgi:hypothetical protein
MDDLIEDLGYSITIDRLKVDIQYGGSVEFSALVFSKDHVEDVCYTKIINDGIEINKT